MSDAPIRVVVKNTRLYKYMHYYDVSYNWAHLVIYLGFHVSETDGKRYKLVSGRYFSLYRDNLYPGRVATLGSKFVFEHYLWPWTHGVYSLFLEKYLLTPRFQWMYTLVNNFK